MKNANLHRAKDARNDEFYTKYEDIEAELCHYHTQLNGKSVFCNFDKRAAHTRDFSHELAAHS